MPEGDTIFKLAAYLGPALHGRRIVRGMARTRVTVDLGGRRVDEVFARGKHLFIALDGRGLLRSHLGMWGSWHSYAEGDRWRHPRQRASIVIDIGERVFVCFNAKEVEWLRQQGARERQLGVTLGPDLLSAEPDLARIVQRARSLGHPDTTISDLLLDQKVACGIGNVYKSETLFVCRCHPETRLDRLDDETLRRLYDEARCLLMGNLRGGPRVTRRASDDAGRLWVYGRTAQPCHVCDTPIRSRLLGRHQRSTFWCPRCQAG
jgi:endonuclease-8